VRYITKLLTPAIPFFLFHWFQRSAHLNVKEELLIYHHCLDKWVESSALPAKWDNPYWGKSPQVADE
jgi:hypothetical protein